MSDISQTELVGAIRQQARQRHDTIYCNNSDKRKILAQIGATAGRVDNLRFHGLIVETHEQFTHPIVCQKGDIFPLAEDWKSL